jgi:predicted peptidase
VIVSPQCPENGWWSSELQIDILNALLDDVAAKYRIDKQRIYVTGSSMGGIGTWYLAAAYPDRFAAIAPICGGGDPKDAPKISHLPTWVFHGESDKTVSISESEKMVNALEECGCRIKFTTYPNTGHDSWTVTYQNPELYEWFLKHTRLDNERYKTNAALNKAVEATR